MSAPLPNVPMRHPSDADCATDEAGHQANQQAGQLAEWVAVCYSVVMIEATKEILRRVENWPQEEQEELAELARNRSAPHGPLHID
jgi:hypothetical protein